jgi:hypothetical protein
VKDNIKIAQEKQKEQYDQKHCKPPKFAVGTKVLKKDFLRKKRKGGGMENKWLGPYIILKDLGKGFYKLCEIASGKPIERIHGAHLNIYNSPQHSQAPGMFICYKVVFYVILIN